MIEYFHTQPAAEAIPTVFPSPFSNVPHPLAVRAAGLLQKRKMLCDTAAEDFFAENGGKMFGVLVVLDSQGQYGFLSAFSGMLNGSWRHEGFAPPVFDSTEQALFWPEGEAALERQTQKIASLKDSAAYKNARQNLETLRRESEKDQFLLAEQHRQNKSERKEIRKLAQDSGDQESIMALSFASQRDRQERRNLRKHWLERLTDAECRVLEFDDNIRQMEKERQRYSRLLHKKLFDTYRLGSFSENSPKKLLRDFFTPNLPPGGTGDCAAPKLLALAQNLKLTPVALAEFWWGRTPASEVRHHGRFYPACRGKCGPILPYMLQGVAAEDAPRFAQSFDCHEPQVVFEDDSLLVVNKPAGMLSVAGKVVTDSVHSRLQSRYGNQLQPLLVHRLDMSTSGLLLVAKSAQIHKKLQAQFIRRQVEKRYVAVLGRRLDCKAGEVKLPLRTDFNDRPRQVVCEHHGKTALTRWELIEKTAHSSRVYFYPHTGRTHQLRVHASHHRGLNAPIVGDELYGKDECEGRLRLHAEKLVFTHPVSGERLSLQCKVPF